MSETPKKPSHELLVDNLAHELRKMCHEDENDGEWNDADVRVRLILRILGMMAMPTQDAEEVSRRLSMLTQDAVDAKTDHWKKIQDLAISVRTQ